MQNPLQQLQRIFLCYRLLVYAIHIIYLNEYMWINEAKCGSANVVSSLCVYKKNEGVNPRLVVFKKWLFCCKWSHFDESHTFVIVLNLDTHSVRGVIIQVVPLIVVGGLEELTLEVVAEAWDKREHTLLVR